MDKNKQLVNIQLMDSQSIDMQSINSQSANNQLTNEQLAGKQLVDKQSVNKELVDKQIVNKQSMDKESMDKKARISPRYILILCTAAYASIYIARHNLSIASPLLTDSGHMTVMDIGFMGSLFFILYSAGRFINGYIGDLISPKRLLIGGLTLAAVTNIGIGFLPSAGVIIGLWGINAAAQSMLWGASLRLVNAAYMNSPRSRLAAVVLSTSVGVGSLLAIIVSSLLVKVGLWSLFTVPGLIVTFICILMILLPNSESGSIQYSWQHNLQQNLRHNRMQNWQHSWQQALNLFKKKEILCMLFPAFAHGMIKENLVLWAPMLFLSAYGIDLSSAAMFVFMMPSAMLLGRVIYPLVERLCSGDERHVSILAFGFCILCLAPFSLTNIFSLTSIPIGLAATLFALAMLAVSAINVAFLAVNPMRYTESSQVSMVAGLLDGTTYIGSSAGSALFAWIINHNGYVHMLGIYILICLMSIGSLLLLKIKKTK